MRPIRSADVPHMSWHARQRALQALERECRAAADRHRAILAARAGHKLCEIEPEDPEVVERRRRILLGQEESGQDPDLRCDADGCDRPHHAHGWCEGHYRRWKKYGDVLAHIPFIHGRGLAEIVESEGLEAA